MAFRWMRLIKMQSAAHSIVVSFDVRAVHPDALKTVTRALPRMAKGRMAHLRFYHGGWVHEVFDGVDQAVERSLSLLNLQHVEVLPPPLLRAEDPAHLDDSQPPLRLDRLAEGGGCDRRKGALDLVALASLCRVRAAARA